MNKKRTLSTNSMLTKMTQGRNSIRNSHLIMVAMITVLSTTLILSGTSHAYAMKSLGENPTVSRVGPHHYGISTKGLVCGDHLCNDISVKKSSMTAEKKKISQNSSDPMPTVITEQIFQSSKQSNDEYVAIFKVTGGDKNLANVQISIESDLDKTSISINGLFANSNQIVEVIVHATDPQSITATPISFQYNN